MPEHKKDLIKIIVIFAAELTILAMFMCSWLGLTLGLFSNENFTLWGISRAVSLVNSIVGGMGLLTAAAVLIYIFLAASIGGIVFTCFTALKSYLKGGVTASMLGFIIPFALSVLMMAAVAAANAFTAANADGFLLFRLTAAPLVVCVLSAGAFAALRLPLLSGKKRREEPEQS